MSFIFHHNEDGHFPPSSSSCAPQHTHDVTELLMRRRSGGSYTGLGRAEEFQPEDDMSDDEDNDSCHQTGNKKRRLSLEQVKALENSFESGNKLEPERKIQLARALGLQPRQIAIWFQNRRARWKTKQLEKDYGVLKAQFESLKAHNHALNALNKKLHSQLMLAMKNGDTTGLESLNDEDMMKNNVVVLSSSVDHHDHGASSSKQVADNLIQDHQRIGDNNNNNINEPLIHNHMLSCIDENNNYQDFWAWHGHQNFQ